MKDEYQLSHQEVDQIKSQESHSTSPIILLLDRLTKPSNIGALFRLADAANIEGIYGFQTNIDLKSRKIEAVSRHSTRHISYKPLNTIEEVVALSKTYYPIALEYTNKSINFSSYKNSKPCMLIVGNEQNGISNELVTLSKASLHIPMHGKNSSMNVSVATGIVLYHLIGLI